MITINIRKSNRANGDFSMFVSFPYDTRIIDIVREMPTRYWDPDSKEWEIPALKLKEFTSKISDFEYELSGEELLEVKEIEKPKDFEFKTKPFKHQIVGFNYGLNHQNWLLGDEQGLGKTKQVIDIAIAKKLQYGYKHCLIICGVNGLKWNWREEIKTHSNEESFILGQRLKKGKIVIGSTKDKINDLDMLLTSPETISEYFLITNVESLRDESITSKISELCKNKTIGLIAADEIHKCFDYDTKIRTNKGILKIGDVVKTKQNISVLSYNEDTNIVEWKNVTDWFENTIIENLIEIQIQTNSGIKQIRCTDTHKFYTHNRGWVCAKDLTSEDDIAEFNT